MIASLFTVWLFLYDSLLSSTFHINQFERIFLIRAYKNCKMEGNKEGKIGKWK
jgi:hypothetical protein